MAFFMPGLVGPFGLVNATRNLVELYHNVDAAELLDEYKALAWDGLCFCASPIFRLKAHLVQYAVQAYGFVHPAHVSATSSRGIRTAIEVVGASSLTVVPIQPTATATNEGRTDVEAAREELCDDEPAEEEPANVEQGVAKSMRDTAAALNPVAAAACVCAISPLTST